MVNRPQHSHNIEESASSTANESTDVMCRKEQRWLIFIATQSLSSTFKLSSTRSVNITDAPCSTNCIVVRAKPDPISSTLRPVYRPIKCAVNRSDGAAARQYST